METTNEQTLIESKRNNFVLIASLLSTLILGLLAHGFAFCNLFPSHDALVEFDVAVGVPHKIRLGRFMYAVLRICLGESVGMPWLSGMLTLLVLGGTCFLICKIFKFEKLWQICLVAGVVATNLVICSTLATYSWDLLGNCLALLFSVLAVFLLQKSTCKIGIYDLCALICMIISMAFYQAFIAVTLTLIIFVYITSLIENKAYTVRELMLSILKVSVMVLLSCLLYYFSAIIVGKITHYGLYGKEGYNSISLEKITLVSLIKNFIYIYHVSFETMFTNTENAFTIASFKFMEYILIAIHVLLILFVLVTFVLKILKEKLPVAKIILICLMVSLLPIGMSFTFLISGVDHMLTRFALNLVYLLVPISCRYFNTFTLPNIRCRYFAYVAVILVFAIVVKNIQVANQVYVKKDLIEKSTMFNMTRIISRIEAEETYEYGKTTVVIIGSVNDIGEDIKNFAVINKITGVEVDSQVSYIGAFEPYCKYYLQYEIHVVDYSAVANETYDQALENLSSFPQKNCIYVADEMIFIKL